MHTFSGNDLPALGTKVAYTCDPRVRGTVIGFAMVHADVYPVPAYNQAPGAINTVAIVHLDTADLCADQVPTILGTPIMAMPISVDSLAPVSEFVDLR